MENGDTPDGNVCNGDVLGTENLVKIFKKRRVVNGVSIRICQGEIVGLLGRTAPERPPHSGWWLVFSAEQRRH
jgi:hypothetical protein